MMMVANLVGFCLGLDGMKAMLEQIFSSTDGKTMTPKRKKNLVINKLYRSDILSYSCCLFICCCSSYVRN
jgi:hypothetical protein